MYQPYQPPQPPPRSGKGLMVTLVAVAVVAALVVVVALAFLLKDRHNQAGDDVSPTYTQTASPSPSPTEDPTVSPTPSPTLTELENTTLVPVMQRKLMEAGLVFAVTQEYHNAQGLRQSTYYVGVDGGSVLSVIDCDGQPCYTINSAVLGPHLEITTLDHVNQEYSQDVWWEEDCWLDNFCDTPQELVNQLGGMLQEVAEAIMANDQAGLTSNFGGTDVVGFTVAKEAVPSQLQHIGAVEVILWIDPDTALPFQVDTKFDVDQLRQAMAAEEFFSWGDGILANSCMNEPPETVDGICQAYTNFTWSTRHDDLELFKTVIPKGYTRVEAVR